MKIAQNISQLAQVDASDLHCQECHHQPMSHLECIVRSINCVTVRWNELCIESASLLIVMHLKKVVRCWCHFHSIRYFNLAVLSAVGVHPKIHIFFLIEIHSSSYLSYDELSIRVTSLNDL